jgi:hypothetical protein
MILNVAIDDSVCRHETAKKLGPEIICAPKSATSLVYIGNKYTIWEYTHHDYEAIHAQPPRKPHAQAGVRRGD